MEAQNGSQAALTTNPNPTANAPTGAYVLRDLITDVPLSAEGDDDSIYITCVDAWSGNLYIGTSAGELLHFVSIPPDPSDESAQPVWILASRLQPPFTNQQEPPDSGVKQILLLPGAGKACVLCNGTLTFYTLPELSPAFGGKIKQSGCTWVGGLDISEEVEDGGHAGVGGTVIVICLRQRLRLIRIGEQASKIRDIQLGSVNAIQRRGSLACVADGTSYSLIDVVNQQKSDLFPISSSSEPTPPPSRQTLEPPPTTRQASRSFSSRSPERFGRTHDRVVSLGSAPKTSDRLHPDSQSPWPARGSSRISASPQSLSSREQSPQKPATPVPTETKNDDQPPTTTNSPARPLPPNIASPTPTEFLLTTGTKANEPGVGMFVNLDGDVVRGTIEFSSYPEYLVLDGSGNGPSDGSPDQGESEGYVLAIVRRQVEGITRSGIEVQRWDAEPGDPSNTKYWIAIDDDRSTTGQEDRTLGLGLRTATGTSELAVPDISGSIRQRRLIIGYSKDESNEAKEKRNREEDAFAARFSQVKASVMLYSHNRVHWVVRNALISRLDQQLNQAITKSEDDRVKIDPTVAQRLINGIRGQDATNELEFLTLTYIRQKASLMLYGHLLLQTASGVIAYERDKRAAADALVEGDLDPRTILILLPPLSEEVQEGDQGIWLSQGLRDTIDTLRRSLGTAELPQDLKGAYGDNLLQVVKRYLLVWRKKKGFGSVADETHVFKTVDAALLRLLLMLDQNSPRGPATTGSLRAELNDVVDKGVDCFDRAVELFEQFGRLYMLSRLYQSKKMVAQVLATWRRILDGERDVGGELIEGEGDMRRYLAKIRDTALVQEYGAYLAHRNPKLGVQIFADETSRVKFRPKDAVEILKTNAPGAVKDYLEHLVFGKNHVQYVNDLIAFYLDTVLDALSSNKTSDNSARTTLLDSYSTYRALKPPKPTYRQFITDNAVEAEWWHNRLRLLQLIGGSHGAAAQYDAPALRERLAPYSEELVPEMIILNGRERKHAEALRLLTHGLGDYDTAIRYCLLGGSSIFHPSSSSSALRGGAEQPPLPTKESQATLFRVLLQLFFSIEDLSERLERTAELLERFGDWFEISEVLGMIPEDWSVEVVSGFLVRALRRLVRERNETGVVKALASAQNLKRAVGVSEKVEGMSPHIVRTEEGESV